MRNRRQNGGGLGLLVTVGLAVFLLPVRAEAHVAIKGAGEFLTGFLHPLLTPLHLLVLLSLGLLVGRSLPFRLEWPIAGFAAFAAAGLSATATGVVSGVPPPVLIVIGLSAGGLVALATPLPMWARFVACAVGGAALGLDSGVGPGIDGASTAKILFATWVSLMGCVGNVTVYTSRLPKYQWVQTGVRVVGSWIVAIALLMLAFSLRR